RTRPEGGHPRQASGHGCGAEPRQESAGGSQEEEGLMSEVEADRGTGQGANGQEEDEESARARARVPEERRDADRGGDDDQIRRAQDGVRGEREEQEADGERSRRRVVGCVDDGPEPETVEETGGGEAGADGREWDERSSDDRERRPRSTSPVVPLRGGPWSEQPVQNSEEDEGAAALLDDESEAHESAAREEGKESSRLDRSEQDESPGQRGQEQKMLRIRGEALQSRAERQDCEEDSRRDGHCPVEESG